MKTKNTLLLLLITFFFINLLIVNAQPNEHNIQGFQYQQIYTECSDIITLFNHSSIDEHSKNQGILPWYPDALRWRKVTIHEEVFDLSNLNEKEYIEFNFFEDESITAKINNIHINVLGTMVISGSISDFFYGFFIITISDNNCFITVEIPEKNQLFIIQHDVNNNVYYLVEEDFSISQSKSLPDTESLMYSRLYDEGSIIVNNDISLLSNNDILLVNDNMIDDDTYATINVMIVYTPAAKNWANANSGGINNRISQAIERGQIALENSNTLIHWNLVHAAEINYTESDSSGSDLNRLRAKNNGYMDEVHEWRDQYGADIVQLFILANYGGGMAYQLENRHGLPSSGFSLVGVQQPINYYTSIHEFGHNMGCHHHKQQDFQPGPTNWQNWPENTWSAGWRWGGPQNEDYRSVMSYSPGARVLLFSNPNINHQGYPTGHVNDGDNARTLREIRHVIAAYRNSPPSADFEFFPSNPKTQTPIHFIDTSTDSDGTIISWHWSFGDGAISTQQSPSHIYSSSSTYAVSLTVTDDKGSTDTTCRYIKVGDDISGIVTIQNHGIEKTFQCKTDSRYNEYNDLLMEKAGSFAGGTGRPDDPYQISNWEHLHNIRYFLDSNFILINNLTSSTYGYTIYASSSANNGAGWLPISNSMPYFSGRFDGLNNTIDNLFISRNDTDFVGLFGKISAATIDNVGLVEANISGKNYVGGIIGYQDGGSVSNSYTSGIVKGINIVGGLVGFQDSGHVSYSYAVGSVTGTGWYVGGLIGLQVRGSISNSYATGNVTGTSNVGGLIACLNDTGNVSDCYAAGNVTGSITVGGLIGSFSGIISNCYATGDVTGINNVGGLIGRSSGCVSISHASGSVKGLDNFVGGLIGILTGDGSVSNSYAMGNVIGTYWVGGLIGYQYGGSVSSSYAMGIVTGIQRAGGLIGLQVNGYVSDSYAVGTVSGAYWVGGLIGHQSGGNISNCYATGIVTTTGWYSGGLIGFLDMGSVSDCYATGAVIGKMDVGGLIGMVTGGGDVSQSSAAGRIIGTDFVGGLIGLLDMGSVSDCFAAGDVTGITHVGGLIGWRYGSSITNSSATGNVNGINHVGGLIGFNYIAGVSKCFATGNVTGINHVGGLIGYGFGSSFYNCYASGSVSGTSSVGGLIGHQDSGSVSNSYALGIVIGSHCVGGLIGEMQGSVSNCFATGNVTGSNHVGGLIGLGGGVVSNSYAVGNVIGVSEVGGFIGRLELSISDCYATGTITRASGFSTRFGGFVGHNHEGKIFNSYSIGSVHYSEAFDPIDKGFAGSVRIGKSYEMSGNFWDMQTSAQSSTAGNATGKTTVQMMDLIIFDAAGWDIASIYDYVEKIWLIDDGIDYPRLSWQYSGIRRQAIVFNEGWNLISFNVVPSNLSLSCIMQPLIDQGILEVMKDGGIGVLWPSFGIDTIGELDVTKGYHVKVTQDCVLKVNGIPVRLPVSIDLQKGWNLIGYPVSEAIDAMSLIQPLIDDDVLIEVVDSCNQKIFFNGLEWVNGIGDFNPGQGYYIKVFSECLLYFTISQTLVFNEGWNLISFNVIPINLSLSRIMKPLIDQGILEVMKDGGMGVLWPSFGIDTIGDMNVTKGYKVKVTQHSAFELRGLPVQLPVSVELQEGWNLVGYPVSSSRNALTILQPLIDQNILIRVRDQNNNEIYQDITNDMWINNIGDFQPGQGYHINVLSEYSLIISE